ncbi:endonuclease V [Roseomonas soli]|uniref:Endonuclease V n=2 Tax=Neoroseomonas soli TaxID=1081025 RepID=A0A9X9WRZ4_9PROT|nr:endonuclease V [Neoroseomonas soli]MBR0669923.1 endonuclease V [Neoroseomonas soli]
MVPDVPHYWLHPRDIPEARAAQAEMAARLVAEDDLPPRIARLGGADVSNTRFDPAKMVHAALVALDASADAVLATATESRRADFPYVPGYLAFREVPPLLACWSRLAVRPEVILVDGHGVAHPRGFGVACHLGLVFGVPTIGVAKSLLVGEGEPGPEPGDTVPLMWKGARIGTALRTRRGARPVYVSTGHRVSLETAVAIVLGATRGRRLPTAIRAAHDAANVARLRT